VEKINQKTGQIGLGLDVEKIGESWKDYVQGKELLTEEDLSERLGKNESLLDLICSQENIEQAMNRVISNKGAAGIDGMETRELRKYMTKNWQTIKEKILGGNYKPQAVKEIEIPKANGKKRKLGIPTVLDRTIQQAINQILQPIWEPKFSENSYGFRPKRSAHQALFKLKENIAEGNTWCVDVDLKNFFNEVNHDKLMYQMFKVVKDKRVLKLIRKYLQSGILANGLVTKPEKGTPQGSPLSPLLSNIILNELDQELEKRNHKFVRYADDFIILVKTLRAGERVKESIKRYLETELKLLVNEEKSEVKEANKVSYLGYRIVDKENPRLGLSLETIRKLKTKIKNLTRRKIGKNIRTIIKDLNTYLRGWLGYFGHAETPSVFKKYNSQIRRRLRSLIWHQWGNGRNRYAQLIKLGVSVRLAKVTACSKNRSSQSKSTTLGMHTGLKIKYFDELGLIRLGPRAC
jgi:RNA-directed DNA polymerase